MRRVHRALARSTDHLILRAGDMTWSLDPDRPPACAIPTDTPPEVADDHHRLFDATGPGRNTEDQWRRIRAAIGICQPCPIQADCLAYAMDPLHHVEGVWGGHYFPATDARRRVSLGALREPHPVPAYRPPTRRRRQAEPA